MSNRTAAAVHWVEQGRVPDRVVRLGIQRLLKTRLAELHDGDAAATAALLARLAALGYEDPKAALRHLEALTAGVTRAAQIAQNDPYANIQGASGEGTRDLFRELTKAMHGLRPLCAMVHVMRAVTRGTRRRSSRRWRSAAARHRSPPGRRRHPGAVCLVARRAAPERRTGPQVGTAWPDRCQGSRRRQAAVSHRGRHRPAGKRGVIARYRRVVTS